MERDNDNPDHMRLSLTTSDLEPINLVFHLQEQDHDQQIRVIFDNKHTTHSMIYIQMPKQACALWHKLEVWKIGRHSIP